MPHIWFYGLLRYVKFKIYCTNLYYILCTVSIYVQYCIQFFKYKNKIL